jgi:hypothetical protein
VLWRHTQTTRGTSVISGTEKKSEASLVTLLEPRRMSDDRGGDERAKVMQSEM